MQLFFLSANSLGIPPDSRWKISRLEYDTLSRADYRSGRSYAWPISVALFAKCFPEDQQGPDDLV